VRGTVKPIGNGSAER